MNKITLTGRLAADPDQRFQPSGNAVLNFRVASDVGYGDHKTTNWFACAIFGKRAESLAAHLKKGQEVTIWGTLKLREWVNKDGLKQLSPDVMVDEIAMHGGKREAAPQDQSDSSIPF